jgi:hypothetical protein
MTRSQKVVLIVLALLLLLLVALIVWGQARPPFTEADKSKYRPGAAMKAIGSLFSSERNRVELPQKRYQLAANQTLPVDIAKWEGDMRTLKLRRIQGAMDVKMEVKWRKGDPDLSNQAKSEALPCDKKDCPEDPERTAYAVTGGGARLTITCTAAPCILETE